MNDENLVPLTTSKAREVGRLGGLASVKARKTKQTFKEVAQMLLELKAPEEVTAKLLKEFPHLDKDQITNRMAMTHAQIKKAHDGEAKSFEVLRDTAGEKPKDELKVTGNITINKVTFKNDRQ